MAQEPQDMAPGPVPEPAAVPELFEYHDFEAEVPVDLDAAHASDFEGLPPIPNLAAEAPAEREPAFTQRTVQVSRGDTLMKLLVEAGAGMIGVRRVAAALVEVDMKAVRSVDDA